MAARSGWKRLAKGVSMKMKTYPNTYAGFRAAERDWEYRNLDPPDYWDDELGNCEEDDESIEPAYMCLGCRRRRI